jgi:UDP-N-acetylmuramoyl-L-alanyl-D-glutamate--2,6-diaminopimelate ligase
MNKQISLPILWPVACHTDYVGKNSTFVAIKGQKLDGIDYVPLALQKGAKTIVAEHTADIKPEIIQAIKAADAQLMFVANARRSLALLSANAWQNPADKLKIIAITGTKGKTTTSWLLYHLLKNAGYRTALLSTVKNKIGEQSFPTELTTAHPDYLHAFFHTCVKEKIDYVIMEVAAQALTLNRVAGLSFDGVIFTNFAQAHGEFYATEAEYADAKKAIVALAKPGAPCVINNDDQMGALLLEEYADATSFGINRDLVNSPFASSEVEDRIEKLSDFSTRTARSKRTVVGFIDSSSATGLTGSLQAELECINFECPALIGDFNLYNILAASTMAWRLGVDSKNIAHGLSTFAGIPGRLEKYGLSNGATCIIDYAHNPLSFKSVLPLLRSLTDHLIVVAGAGGDRDRAMRPVMGQLMAEYADCVFITTDNPRSENPADIIGAIYDGISADQKNKVVCEADRRKAIELAYRMSKSNSIIALLGKGPDEYQIFGTIKQPFSERAIVQSL